MVGDSSGARIVRSYSDSSCGTGDRYLVTEHGEVWLKTPVSLQRTGDREPGTERDGQIYRGYRR